MQLHRANANHGFNNNICVVGLGYVGLPLCVQLSKYFPVVGFDINQIRVDQLNAGIDYTKEIDQKDLGQLKTIKFSDKIEIAKKCTVYIITVPTPIDNAKVPDLRPLISASRCIGSVLKKDDLVIYESTVYPGVTEDICVKELETASGLNYESDFMVGYSPERINPGDDEHKIYNISKIISGTNDLTLKRLRSIYEKVTSAQLFEASSIKVAESAKVIENIQRDINIAFMNELYEIFDRLDIPVYDVLAAAGTKWNFLNFRPGLVGGHCIGVDPYYLAHKAHEIGVLPELILSGRRINDNFSEKLAQKFIKKLLEKKINPINAKVLILGVSFKEDCPDVRNSKVFDVINELQTYGLTIHAYDPLVDPADVLVSYNIQLTQSLEAGSYDAVFISVVHNDIKKLSSKEIKDLTKENSLIFDYKSIFGNDFVC